MSSNQLGPIRELRAGPSNIQRSKPDIGLAHLAQKTVLAINIKQTTL